jgi:hypothetical protein
LEWKVQLACSIPFTCFFFENGRENLAFIRRAFASGLAAHVRPNKRQRPIAHHRAGPVCCGWSSSSKPGRLVFL